MKRTKTFLLNFILSPLAILIFCSSLIGGCSTHTKSMEERENQISPHAQRSPAGLGHQCRELVSKIWRSSPYEQTSPEQAARLNKPLFEILEEEQGVDLTQIDDFLSGRYRVLNDGEFGPLRRAFIEEILPSTQEDQQQYAAGLLLVLKQRRPELSTSSLIAHYHRLLKSCI